MNFKKLTLGSVFYAKHTRCTAQVTRVTDYGIGFVYLTGIAKGQQDYMLFTDKDWMLYTV